MTVPRIYFPKELEKGRIEEITGTNLRYIRDILRLRKNDTLILFGSGGMEYDAEIVDFQTKSIVVGVTRERRIPQAEIRVVLAQALPKGDKMDLIIQKAAELGTTEVIPFISSRSIPKFSDEKARQRVERWRKIAVEASRQCGRADIPRIEEIVSYDNMLNGSDKGGLRLIFWEAEAGRGIKEILRDEKYGAVRDFFIAVGPEGGFSGEEVARAERSGFLSTGLGRQILRVETASLAILSILQYERGILGSVKGTEEA
ncbi:MAG: 16S rRNA (uracil(1498)-N(3))-methyltransferase [Syntrophales bacterium]